MRMPSRARSAVQESPLWRYAMRLDGRLRHLALFHLLLAGPTLVVVCYFLGQAPAAPDWRSAYYLWTLPSYYVVALLLVALICLPLSLTRWTACLVPVLGASELTYLVVDTLVYTLYRFHVTPFLIQMFVLDFKGMGIPAWLLGVAFLAWAMLIALVALAWQLAGRLYPRAGRWLMAVFLLTSVVFISNQIIHVWAERYHRSEITRYTPLFPMYYPLVSQKEGIRLSNILPSLFPPVSGGTGSVLKIASTHVQYPLRPLNCSPKERPNILFVVLESWQADTLRPEVMPTLSRVADDAWDFRQHVSGGNATVPGLFSLLFGLHASYYESFRASPENNPSVFTETLDRQGYRSRVFTSSDLRNFSMRELMFPRVAATDYAMESSTTADRNDRRLVDRFVASLKRPTEDARPRFDFLFLTSSHSSYDYPLAFRKFTPVAENKGLHLLVKGMDAAPVKNHYLNSLHYLDSLLGDVFSAVKASGRWENTWIVVTGDHAEEFNENGRGFWGHNGNFTRWQTQPPLIVKPAGRYVARAEVRYSTHQDVVPTLMTEALGCPAPAIPDYSNGTLLTELPQRRSTVVASYMTSAYWIDGIVYEKNLVGRNYAWSNMNTTFPTSAVSGISALMKEETLFLRK